jgi:hypothetical protein
MKNSLLLGLVSIVLAGCSAKENLYFGTGTSVGLDIVGTPTSPVSASLAYKRTEVSFSKQQKGQNPYSVLGVLDMNVDFWAGTKVDQHFATGAASKIAAYEGLKINQNQSEAAITENKIKQLIDNSPSIPVGAAKKQDQKFLFVTGSTIGINLDVSRADPHAVVGYKRSENAYIPVSKDNGTVGSVYSRMQFDSQSDKSSVMFTNTEIKQSFATGTAARILASHSSLGAEAIKIIAPDNPSK